MSRKIQSVLMPGWTILWLTTHYVLLPVIRPLKYITFYQSLSNKKSRWIRFHLWLYTMQHYLGEKKLLFFCVGCFSAEQNLPRCILLSWNSIWCPFFVFKQSAYILTCFNIIIILLLTYCSIHDLCRFKKKKKNLLSLRF